LAVSFFPSSDALLNGAAVAVLLCQNSECVVCISCIEEVHDLFCSLNPWG